MTRLPVYQPTRYLIVVGNHVNPVTFGPVVDFQFTHKYTAEREPFTILVGTLQDQAALHGILSQIRDWSLPLYQVKWLGAGNYEPAEIPDNM